MNTNIGQNYEFATTLKVAFALMLCLLLVACNGDQGDDLDAFMKNAGNEMQVKIKPLPEVKPYLALQYNADNLLNDPFRPRKASTKATGVLPNFNRAKEPMEAYPLESIQYVGHLSKGKFAYALLRTPDSGIQQAKVGNFIGQNYGMITKITDGEISLKEIVQDDLSGDWIERQTTLTIQE
ncbi:MAG TPA: pilus assembly protein PilP [Methylotenera sp.]|nr:pilus assembly protein PilP [Methylotenera sp.]HPH05444.1 pilus assembly protein PilP [Methylotenera sp.]HPN02147.1 pilus assembly protein PilP [Methylotenera sp.]